MMNFISLGCRYLKRLSLLLVIFNGITPGTASLDMRVSMRRRLIMPTITIKRYAGDP
jgi:hypothetical protein